MLQRFYLTGIKKIFYNRIKRRTAMDNYKYKLQYTNNDFVVSTEFNAEVTGDELKEHLRCFLRGCSWGDRNLRFLEDDPEEAIRSDILSEQYDRISDIIKRAEEEDWSSDKILEELKSEYL